MNPYYADYEKEMNAQERRDRLILDVAVDVERRRRETWKLCGQRESSFERGPLLWLTTHTLTEDQHWLAKGTQPTAPFPRLSYFQVVMRYMISEPVLFIWKSRELMTSWLACGYIAWMCQWFPHVMWMVQTEKEQKAIQLIEYCRILHRRQASWMKQKNELVVDNTTELVYANGSKIVAIPKGVNQVRLYHPHGYLMDEAAFLPEAEECFNAARPVVKQILAVSTDEMGWFHNCCSN
jgi:hypothetical protein